MLLFLIVYETTIIILSLISYLFSCFEYQIQVCNMADTNNNAINTTDTRTTRSIVMENGTWSSGIRTILIYTSGILQMEARRAKGLPTRRFGIMASCLALDTVAKVFENAINDPNYVLDHHRNWKLMWSKDKNGNTSTESVTVDVSGDTGLASSIKEAASTSTATGSDSAGASSFLPSFDYNNLDLSSIGESIINPIVKFLEPQVVNYPVEVLMDQHHFISICLFIFTLCLIFFFYCLIFSVVLILFKDKILGYFKNKYILMYLNLQFRFIYIEIICSALFMVLCLYYILKGLYFLSIYPISYNLNP